jgi:hypothetical protein
MNRVEKKKLRKKYLQTVNNILYNFEKDSEVTDIFNDRIELLKDLIDIISYSDFNIFYELNRKYMWPSKYDMTSGRKLKDILEKLKEDPYINRDYIIDSILK